MKTALIACAIAIGSAAPLGVSAHTAKPEPEITFTGNAGLFSDYRYRGYSQTDYRPAFQGGFDFAHKSGFYLGNWNSNVSSVLFNGASLEMDFYGGYKTTFGDFGLEAPYSAIRSDTSPTPGAIAADGVQVGERGRHFQTVQDLGQASVARSTWG